MSKMVNGITIIEAEPDFICGLCGKIAETRPYGPNGEEICWECGEKDPVSRDRMMGIKLFGEKP